MRTVALHVQPDARKALAKFKEKLGKEAGMSMTYSQAIHLLLKLAMDPITIKDHPPTD